jgi:hypothetical protein
VWVASLQRALWIVSYDYAALRAELRIVQRTMAHLLRAHGDIPVAVPVKPVE